MWNAKPEEIAAAVMRIDPEFLGTPVRRSPTLDNRLAAELLFKDETATPIRSFKGRGACNYLAQVHDAEGFVCASAGNFGQGIAWAARRRGLPLTVFAPSDAVQTKISAMRALGATVILEGKDYDHAKEAARRFCASTNVLLIEDGAHPAIAEGAGTISLELTEAFSDIDVLICPLGNGALAAGVGCWMKHEQPSSELVAVSAQGAPAMAHSIWAGRVEPSLLVNTIADGIAVRVPIPSAVNAVRRVVDDVVLVSDQSIREAMSLLLETFDVVIEPAGAAGFAAVLNNPSRWAGKRIAIPLSGGNV
jgi:threonine dehydratase